MKSRGILFNGEMVRAILGGTKVQTRRPINPQPRHAQVHDWKGKRLYDAEHRMWWWKAHCWDRLLDNAAERAELARLCPLGVPGDRLWVRETFCRVDDREFDGQQWIDYRATPKYGEDSPAGWDRDECGPGTAKWTPSIHMPRDASRITLEVTGVRVERVQDISEADVRAEGVRVAATLYNDGTPRPQDRVWPDAFGRLWDSVYSDELAWSSNPWCWSVAFRRIDG